MTSTGARPSRRKLPNWVAHVIAYSVSAACLVWVLHGYPLSELSADIASLEWRWVTVAVLADLSAYVAHGWRWNVLLRPVIRLRLWRTVQAIFIGLFANDILPLRAGELIRVYLLSHWNDIWLSVCLASAAVERLIDGLWILITFAVTASLVPHIPRDITVLVQIMAVVLVAGCVVLVWIVTHYQHAHAVIRETKWGAALRHVIEGLHLMGSPAVMTRTVVISGIYLALQFFSVYALMKAFLLDLSFWQAAGVLIIVRLGTVVPNAPGNVGLFQASTVLALRLFDVEPDVAKGFSMVMFGVLTIPLLVGGAIAMALTDLNLGELHHHAKRGVSSIHASPARGER
jgi:glycosyltransferase 2 family protein